MKMNEKTVKIIKIIKKGNITQWVNELMKEYEVIAPVKESDEDIFFRIVKSADEICMDFSNTVLSPKEFFFPQSENIFEFDGEEILDIDIDRNDRKKILFGVRPCDVNSLMLLDNVYMGEFNDTYYSKRRENTIIISAACSDPGEHCFCKSTGTGPSLCDADIILTDMGDSYFVESKTNDMVNLDIFKEPTSDDIELKGIKQKESDDKIAKTIDLDKNLDDLDLDATAKRCLACACCTYICPTCTCFDVIDESMISTRKGKRIRCWDSCMFSCFTLLAGGENPREKKVERFKQRLYHKFKYYPERYGKIACVGCGRCIKRCPVNIDIMAIMGGALK